MRCNEYPTSAAYWPVLGLVLGPGEVLGVGLVVLGVSVPMPPAASSDMLPDPPDELPGDVVLPDESEGMPDEPPVLDPLVPTLDPSEGSVELTPCPPVEVPTLGLAGETSWVPVPEVPLVPELLPMPESEPPPVMPAHAPSSIAQAIGNIHFVIDYSRKFQKTVCTGAHTGGLHCECRE